MYLTTPDRDIRLWSGRRTRESERLRLVDDESHGVNGVLHGLLLPESDIDRCEKIYPRARRLLKGIGPVRVVRSVGRIYLKVEVGCGRDTRHTDATADIDPEMTPVVLDEIAAIAPHIHGDEYASCERSIRCHRMIGATRERTLVGGERDEVVDADIRIRAIRMYCGIEPIRDIRDGARDTVEGVCLDILVLQHRGGEEVYAVKGGEVYREDVVRNVVDALVRRRCRDISSIGRGIRILLSEYHILSGGANIFGRDIESLSVEQKFSSEKKLLFLRFA